MNSASFSPDGTKVVSGSNDETVRIWDAVTCECEQTLAHVELRAARVLVAWHGGGGVHQAPQRSKLRGCSQHPGAAVVLAQPQRLSTTNYSS